MLERRSLGRVAERRRAHASWTYAGGVVAGATAENHQVKQAVGAEAVGAVHRDAGAFAGGIQAVDNSPLRITDHNRPWTSVGMPPMA